MIVFGPNDEAEISVCDCRCILPDWTGISPRITRSCCLGRRWRIEINGTPILDACDTLLPDIVEELIKDLTGGTRDDLWRRF